MWLLIPESVSSAWQTPENGCCLGVLLNGEACSKEKEAQTLECAPAKNVDLANGRTALSTGMPAKAAGTVAQIQRRRSGLISSEPS